MRIIKANALIGLMFRKKGLGSDAILLDLGFEGRLLATIHTFFCNFPIDIIWFNKNMKIVEVKENVQPWKVVVPKNKARYVVELDGGFTEKNGLMGLKEGLYKRGSGSK